MKENIRKHNKKRITKAIESSKSLKQTKQKQRFGKGQLIYIMEKDATHIHDKELLMNTWWILRRTV